MKHCMYRIDLGDAERLVRTRGVGSNYSPLTIRTFVQFHLKLRT